MTIENLREMIKSTKSPEWLDLIEQYHEITRDNYKKLVSAALKYIDEKSDTKKGKLMIEWANQHGVNLELDRIKGLLLQPVPAVGPAPKRDQIQRIVSWLKTIPAWHPSPEIHRDYTGGFTVGNCKVAVDQWGYNIFDTPKQVAAKRVLLNYEKEHGRPLYVAEVRKSDPVDWAPEPHKESKKSGNKT